VNFKIIISCVAFSLTLPTSLVLGQRPSTEGELKQLKELFIDQSFLIADGEILPSTIDNNGNESFNTAIIVQAIYKDIMLKSNLIVNAHQGYLIKEYMFINKTMMDELLRNNYQFNHNQKRNFRFVRNLFYEQRSQIKLGRETMRQQLEDYRVSFTLFNLDSPHPNLINHNHLHQDLLTSILTQRVYLTRMVNILEKLTNVLMNTLEDEALVYPEQILIFTNLKQSINVLQQNYKDLKSVNIQIKNSLVAYNLEEELGIELGLIDHVIDIFRLNYFILNDAASTQRYLITHIGNSENINYINQLTQTFIEGLAELEAIYEQLLFIIG